MEEGGRLCLNEIIILLSSSQVVAYSPNHISLLRVWPMITHSKREISPLLYSRQKAPCFRVKVAPVGTVYSLRGKKEQIVFFRKQAALMGVKVRRNSHLLLYSPPKTTTIHSPHLQLLQDGANQALLKQVSSSQSRQLCLRIEALLCFSLLTKVEMFLKRKSQLYFKVIKQWLLIQDRIL